MAMKAVEFFRLWAPVIVWMAIIFLLSSRQRIEISSEHVVNFVFFKALHMIEYAVLFLLSYRAVNNTLKRKNAVNPFILAIVLTMAYAISDELHQSFVPTREGKARDVIIDALGAILAWVALKRLLPRVPKKLNRWVKALQLF